MSILVTGASGHIGSNVVRMLLGEEKEVVGFSLYRPGPNSVLAGVLDRVPFVTGNITDLAGLLNMIKQYRVEGIIHTAVIMGTAANVMPIDALRVNIEGTANVLEATRILGLRRAVVCSSAAGVGRAMDLTKPLTEADFDYPPPSIYGTTKMAVEGITYNYRRLFNVSAISIRPSRVYGPGFARLDIPIPIEELVKDAVAGRPIKLREGGDTAIDYTYVKDVSRALILGYECKETKNWLFNVSFGELRSVSQIAEVLRGLFPKLPIEVGSGKWGKGAKGLTYKAEERPPFDIRRAREDLRYEPLYDIEKGISAYVAWLQEGKYL